MWRHNHDQGNMPPDPQDEVGMMQLDDKFTELRYAWLPNEAMSKVHTLLDEARADGQHVWSASEHYQAFAVGSFVAAARRTMAEGLLSGTETNLNFRGKYPQQAVDLAKDLYLDAEKWNKYAGDVYADEDYRVGREKLTVQAAWPLPPRSHVSPYMMDGLRFILELNGTETPSLHDVMRDVDAEVDGPNRLGYFDRYKEQIDKEQRKLDRKVESIRERWRDEMDPNTEPGLSLYKDMVQCAEAYVALGVHKLMPATLDPQLRVRVRPKQSIHDVQALPSFDRFRDTNPNAGPPLQTFELPEPAPQEAEKTSPQDVVPSLPTFTGRPAETTPEEPALPSFQLSDATESAPSKPTLPSFDAGTVGVAKPAQTETGDADTAPKLPPFTLAHIVGREALSAEQADAPALPTFSLGMLMGQEETTTSDSERGKEDDGPTLPPFTFDS